MELQQFVEDAGDYSEWDSLDKVEMVLAAEGSALSADGLNDVEIKYLQNFRRDHPNDWVVFEQELTPAAFTAITHQLSNCEGA